MPDAGSLIPAPASLEVGTGPCFRFTPGGCLVTGPSPSPEEIALGVLAADLVGRRVGFPNDLFLGAGGDGQTVLFALDDDAGPPAADARERYPLTVTGDRIELLAPRPAGLVRGLAVVRHFVSVDGVKSLLSVMGDYKLNVLHLHLTDDQGWRIALPSRPLLTERSA